VDRCDDGVGGLVFPEAEVLHPAHLLLVREHAGEALVDAERLLGFVGP